jgi:hypothetical protein
MIGLNQMIPMGRSDSVSGYRSTIHSELSRNVSETIVRGYSTRGLAVPVIVAVFGPLYTLDGTVRPDIVRGFAEIFAESPAGSPAKRYM